MTSDFPFSAKHEYSICHNEVLKNWANFNKSVQNFSNSRYTGLSDTELVTHQLTEHRK